MEFEFIKFSILNISLNFDEDVSVDFFLSGNDTDVEAELDTGVVDLEAGWEDVGVVDFLGGLVDLG